MLSIGWHCNQSGGNKKTKISVVDGTAVFVYGAYLSDIPQTPPMPLAS